MDPQDILNSALAVHNARKQHTKDQLKQMHPVFSESYSLLFDMCLTDDMDIKILKRAIALLHIRKKNEMGEHDSDVEFGKVLAEKYLPNK